MQPFTDYIRQRLETSGYEFTKQFANLDLFMRSPDGKPIWICYLEVEIDPEQIRRMFDFVGHVLIVVNEKLIPDEIVSRKETSQWLRVLHGLYLGRVYVWNNKFLFGLHFDYENGDVSESGIIQPDGLLLVETGTWLRGWTGTYKLARFYDRAWWSPEAAEGYSGRRDNYQDTHQQQQSNARTEYEQARDHYWQQQREREQEQASSSGKYRWVNREPPAPETSKPDFMREFARAGSPSAVKALYRTLAKKYHPDLNPGVDTTAEMQAVNAAYEQYQ